MGRYDTYLRQVGIAACRAAPLVADHPLLDDFERWMRVHRGLADDTLARYRSLVMELLETLGNDPRQFDARRIRAFVIARARRGPGRVKDVGLATRAFLRHLSTLGRCPTSLLDAVPAMAVWRLARLPKYLSAADVARVIASCRPATTAGSRDRAVLLLLARLALRAGDIVAMRTRDIDWREGTTTVMGKSQRQSRLPLPQDAGDAILAYLRKRPKVPTDRLFLRVHAPWRPLSKRGTVSAIVRGAIRRAGVDAPCLGAHVLRHSAATEMLRRGASQEAIGSVLRHRSIETTAIYTNVDVDLLQRVVQPWPGPSS